jgi:hypothetical protein
MNRLFLKRFRMLLVFLGIFSSVSFSQFDNVDFLKSIPADGAKFVQAYITPYANAFGAGLNGSWYNTAKPHKLGGFDVTVGLNVGMVPAADETYDLSKLELSAGMNPKTGSAPTIAGPDNDGPLMNYSVNVPVAGSVTLASFNTPPGTGWKYIPVPTAQVGIGLPLGTEIKGRFIPKIPIKGADIMLWGVGLMHSIMQYIPGNELLPVDASIFAGYTRLIANVPINLQPGTPQAYSSPYSLTSFNDQNFSATVEALNISAIASVNLPVISFYGGLGYSKTKTLLELTGNFPTPTLVTPAAGAPYSEYNNTGVVKGESFPKMNIENFSGLRANIGFRLKFAVITIHADYTRAQYNVVSTGLGFSFR